MTPHMRVSWVYCRKECVHLLMQEDHPIALRVLALRKSMEAPGRPVFKGGEDWTARLRTLLIKAHAGACGNGWLNMQQPYRTIPRSVAVISVAAVLVCSIVAIKRRQTPASL
mmetsp:Transcript_1927/g.6914  ORF Transcript_1927/g.6914 Transcript_1927/m.6914 type:complete len:112 (-) Transcript_1927:698-1033(-)